MNYGCFITDDAADDISKAREWYEEQQSGRGDLFKQAVYKKIDTLKHTPLMHGLWRKTYRRGMISGYPYSILYSVGRKSVMVIAVLHDHQDIDSILLTRG